MAKEKDFKYVSGKKYDGMMGRCYRESDRSYSRYGERGIKVCASWIKDINIFRLWLLSELDRNNISIELFISNSKSYQLDRINTDGHYSPDNCRIVTPQVNARNKERTKGQKIISAEGEEIEI